MVRINIKFLWYRVLNWLLLFIREGILYKLWFIDIEWFIDIYLVYGIL